MAFTKQRHRLQIALLAGTLAAALPGTAVAQEPYPARPVKLIASIAAGGLADTLALAIVRNITPVCTGTKE